MGSPYNSQTGPPLVDRRAVANGPPLLDSTAVLSPPVAAAAATQTQATAPNAKTTKETLTEALGIQLNLLHFVQEAFFTLSTLISLTIYSGITAAVLYGDALMTNGIVEYLDASKASVGFFSSFLGFSLVFRTNICYNRWWEGRCLWGALIFSAIHLAQQGQCWIKDKENLRRLCCAAVTFPYACKAQLRGVTIMEDGAYLLQRGLINPAQLEIVSKRKGWQPYYFLGVMRAAINIELEKSTKANSGDDNYSFRGSTTKSQILIFEDSLTTLATSIGGLIRVKSTGLPMAYDLLFSIIFSIFFLIATLAWAPTLGWYTPIVIGVLRFTVKLIIVIGSEMEDPFGDDVTDLPMLKFCLAIETQIEAIFNDAFPANSLGGQWPMPMGAAPPKHTTTQNSSHDKSTACLTEMTDGSTARATFQRTSELSRSQSFLHVYGDRTKKARGDSFDEAGMLRSQRTNGSTARANFQRTNALSRSQSILHVYGDRTKKARGDSFDEAGMLRSSQRTNGSTARANFQRTSELSRSQSILHMYSGRSARAVGDKIVYTLSNGDTEDFVSDISKDEERRIRRRRKDQDDRVQQLRRRGGEPSVATAGKKKGLSGNKKSSRGKKEVVKLAVSHGSDDTSSFSEDTTSAEALLVEAIMAQQSKNLKKRSAKRRQKKNLTSSTDSSRRDRDSSDRRKKVRSKSCEGDNANSNEDIV